MNKITIAGNIFVDNVKEIDVYPQESMLCHIGGERRNVGGCVSNTGISIASIDRSLPVFAAGNIGDDDNGKFILGEYAGRGVRTEGVRKTEMPTGYTDVYLSSAAKTRTFFNKIGANTTFGIDCIDLDAASDGILHIGYIMLLPALDAPDDEYGTKMAWLLAAARKRGIKTSVDAVSEQGTRFAKLILPALRHSDYAILNEIEGGNAVSVSARGANGKLIIENVKEICKRLLIAGVKECAVIHSPEGGFAMDKSGRYEAVPTLDLPKSYIKGTVGAGDAFCAGTLYGIYNGMTLNETLKTADLAAAACLSENDSVSGMRSYADILKIENRFARTTFR